MKDISEYSPTFSPYETLIHLEDKIMSGELKTFQALKSYAAVLVGSQRGKVMLKRAFDLQRQLHWGFFRDLQPATFPALWSQVVLPDPDFDFAGDLKGYMSIPDVYVGILDIHGYTHFCRENRNNMSRLDLLDRMLHEEVRAMAARQGVLARRARGDEILMLSASASDLAETALALMDHFSKPRRVSLAKDGKAQGNDMLLPPFQLSAGLAGGQKYTPLVVTRDGDLSGDIVNTAARLQARATRLSPHRNRMLITSHVQQKLAAGNNPRQHPHLADAKYLNTGSVSFKGTSLLVFDAVFVKTEAWRLDIQQSLEDLYSSLEKGMWRSKVLEDALALIIKLAKCVPTFSIQREGGGPQIDAMEFLGMTRKTAEAFAADRFEEAIEAFNELVNLLSALEGIDEVALEYLKGIAEGYASIAEAFASKVESEIFANPGAVLGAQASSSFETLKKHSELYAGLLVKARLSVKSRKASWYNVADECAPANGVRIESRK
ncbi:MAG TPA: hypothetical protein VMV83_03210 [Rectinemataceae bacterium]|nr:hypothetical protein [Rectinemataceae bacterium]